jgi:hypothetical protein
MWNRRLEGVLPGGTRRRRARARTWSRAGPRPRDRRSADVPLRRRATARAAAPERDPRRESAGRGRRCGTADDRARDANHVRRCGRGARRSVPRSRGLVAGPRHQGSLTVAREPHGSCRRRRRMPGRRGAAGCRGALPQSAAVERLRRRRRVHTRTAGRRRIGVRGEAGMARGVRVVRARGGWRSG